MLSDKQLYVGVVESLNNLKVQLNRWCRGKEVHIHGAGRYLAGQNMPLVPLLGASTVVSPPSAIAHHWSHS